MTRTPLSRSEGQRSICRGRGILWRPPAQLVCYPPRIRRWKGHLSVLNDFVCRVCRDCGIIDGFRFVKEANRGRRAGVRGLTEHLDSQTVCSSASQTSPSIEILAMPMQKTTETKFSHQIVSQACTIDFWQHAALVLCRRIGRYRYESQATYD